MYSDDGQYFWDGTEWKPTNGELPLDLNQYPTIQALIQAGDADTWLRTIGLNPDELASVGNPPAMS